ncbi:hypothetical protein RSOL_323080 [Rhizoctonia solani AG-3 Rhs1AP]|uniref:Uncharacterized protein n=2 Tax=Rhizoctonia solani AG-3 TaxID=1086053 RepID=A0A074SYB5_9AGAM|nr:hypothetical protein RSOL_323080 [Rhizoctonia solani AG-3 Rhs1AP]KEP54812.1 hypothetical protein V565_012840 [Rhizoctonia solani 123E]
MVQVLPVTMPFPACSSRKCRICIQTCSLRRTSNNKRRIRLVAHIFTHLPGLRLRPACRCAIAHIHLSLWPLEGMSHLISKQPSKVINKAFAPPPVLGNRVFK